jgi:hypothetical protein
MTALADLWLPLLLAAVFIFIASSIIHMTPLWHKNDFPPLPNEEAARAAIGPLNVPPGDYMLPRCKSMKEYGTPEFQAKVKQGPNWIITAMPLGGAGMGKSLVLWFVHIAVVLVFAAYVSSHALPAGAHYLDVFRFIGTTAFMGFALGSVPQSIWYQRRWSLTIKHVFDSLIYACVAAGTFGWLWPKAM